MPQQDIFCTLFLPSRIKKYQYLVYKKFKNFYACNLKNKFRLNGSLTTQMFKKTGLNGIWYSTGKAMEGLLSITGN